MLLGVAPGFPCTGYPSSGCGMQHQGSHTDILCVIADGYPQDEMIYKWRKNSVAAADQKSWRLYQFDFMGLRNTTDIIKTTAGKEAHIIYNSIFKVGT